MCFVGLKGWDLRLDEDKCDGRGNVENMIVFVIFVG
jgi:hypothetical protein